jgi:hypothetical protein
MRPNLGAEDQPAEPQTQAGLAGAGADRSATDRQVMSAYSGKIPDYVIGTDWVRPRLTSAPSEPEPRVRAVVNYYDPPPMDDLPERALSVRHLSAYADAAAAEAAAIEDEDARER